MVMKVKRKEHKNCVVKRNLKFNAYKICLIKKWLILMIFYKKKKKKEKILIQIGCKSLITHSEYY